MSPENKDNEGYLDYLKAVEDYMERSGIDGPSKEEVEAVSREINNWIAKGLKEGRSIALTKGDPSQGNFDIRILDLKGEQ